MWHKGSRTILVFVSACRHWNVERVYTHRSSDFISSWVLWASPVLYRLCSSPGESRVAVPKVRKWITISHSNPFHQLYMREVRDCAALVSMWESICTYHCLDHSSLWIFSIHRFRVWWCPPQTLPQQTVQRQSLPITRPNRWTCCCLPLMDGQRWAASGMWVEWHAVCLTEHLIGLSVHGAA